MLLTDIQLLCAFAGLGFHLVRNGHKVIEIYFKNAYIDEVAENAGPEDIQRVCQDYWAAVNEAY